MNRHLVILLCLIAVINGFGQTKTPLSGIARADSLLFAGDSKSARDLYNKLVHDTAKNAAVWSRYGLANLNLRSYKEAITLFGKALSLKAARPVRMNTYASLARASAAVGNIVGAITSLDSAASLGYLNYKLVDSNDDFKSIRDDIRFKEMRDKVYFNFNPCMKDAHSREFDFWLGEWDVFITGTKTLAGHSRIDLVAGGCSVLENWDSNGSTGKSLNFVDPATGKWRQTWIGSYANGMQDFVDGEYKDGAMRFVFEAMTGNQKVIGRFVFYNVKPGEVRQFQETSSDNGKTWVTSYDFTYYKKF